MVKGLFIDYSSAFNTVLQSKLLLKIHDNDPYLSKWLASYMQGWRQKVKANKGKSSEEIVVTVGIPQGGPLSAKLFTYDTDEINNDIIGIDLLKGNLAKYSDDTRILHIISKGSPEKDNTAYISCANKLAELSAYKNLQLNLKKCEEIVFHHVIKQEKLIEIANEKLVIKDTEIPRSDAVK
jgi:hypothetical protein